MSAFKLCNLREEIKKNYSNKSIGMLVIISDHQNRHSASFVSAISLTFRKQPRYVFTFRDIEPTDNHKR